ncbi:hypothetical protein A9308_09030 [Moraxella atlantae]|uniref:Uncharacterized protein n=2 Tax=Faucicola atlantae TaxID=34059 RepID=A0A1B8QAF5_9GAMM|nr:hypothetical protein [Moraxella atlantae]OBX76268.1 hypothetical protein A9308_09030 [Moraxella atlantae]
MFNKLAVTVLSVIGLLGCTSQSQKLAMPKGNWQMVNPTGFIPPNTEVFQEPQPKNIELVEHLINAYAQTQDQTLSTTFKPQAGENNGVTP